MPDGRLPQVVIGPQADAQEHHCRKPSVRCHSPHWRLPGLICATAISPLRWTWPSHISFAATLANRGSGLASVVHEFSRAHVTGEKSGLVDVRFRLKLGLRLGGRVYGPVSPVLSGFPQAA